MIITENSRLVLLLIGILEAYRTHLNEAFLLFSGILILCSEYFLWVLCQNLGIGNQAKNG